MSNTILTLALVVLAVYRVSIMVTREDGPFDLFSKWRGYVGQKTWIGRGFHCLWCVSFWLAFAGSAFISPDLKLYILYSLAIGGAILVLDQYLRRV